MIHLFSTAANTGIDPVKAMIAAGVAAVVGIGVYVFRRIRDALKEREERK